MLGTTVMTETYHGGWDGQAPLRDRVTGVSATPDPTARMAGSTDARIGTS